MAKNKKNEFYFAFTTEDARNLVPQINADISKVATEAARDVLASRKAETVYVKVISADDSQKLVINDVEGMYEDKKLKGMTYLAKATVTVSIEILPNK